MFDRLFARRAFRCVPDSNRFDADRALRLHCRDRLRAVAAGLIALASLGSPSRLPAAEAGDRVEPVQSLDEQVQEIKSDVLAIAAELGNLEEKLLYPSDTQLALFVSLAQDDSLEIDSASVRLDGQLVAQHVYSWQELQALAKGGVQRLHTANVTTGQHELEVSIAGRRGGDKPFDLVERHAFEKAVGPQKLGIRVGSGATGGATVAIEAW
ncbi:MAG: hypothetical protein R3F35_22345 [Myxococcota bacterium]